MWFQLLPTPSAILKNVKMMELLYICSTLNIGIYRHCKETGVLSKKSLKYNITLVFTDFLLGYSRLSCNSFYNFVRIENPHSCFFLEKGSPKHFTGPTGKRSTFAEALTLSCFDLVKKRFTKIICKVFLF